MTSIEIIALVLIALVLTKLIVISINPVSWKSVIKKFYAKPAVTMVFGLAAAMIILRYLLRELTIVQIFASMTFMMALMMVQFAIFKDEILEMTEKFFENRSIMKKAWFVMLIWSILMAWVVYEIFV